jgi:hypothetical protein
MQQPHDKLGRITQTPWVTALPPTQIRALVQGVLGLDLYKQTREFSNHTRYVVAAYRVSQVFTYGEDGGVRAGEPLNIAVN